MLFPIATVLLVELIEIGVIPVNKDPAFDDMRFEPGRGVAERPGSGLNDVFERLFGIPFDKGSPLDWPQFRPNTDRLQVVEDRLTDVCVGRVAVIVTGVKTVGEPGLGK